MKPVKILFLHGLESGPTGRKVQYLQSRFPGPEYEVIVPDLRTGMYDFGANSAMMQGLLNLPYLLIGKWYDNVCAGMLKGGCEIAAEAIRKHEPDIVVASSMGGAIALELIENGVINVPTILLAPALKRVKLGGGDTREVDSVLAASVMDPWYESFRGRVVDPENGSAKFRVLIIHGDGDVTVNMEDSKELVSKCESAVELVTAVGGDHALNRYLLDHGEEVNQLEGFIRRMMEK